MREMPIEAIVRSVKGSHPEKINTLFSKLFILLILFTLLLSACTTSKDINYHSGREGLVITFEKMPKQVYESTAQPLSMRVWNKGVADVPYNDILFTLKGDPFYVTVEQDQVFSSEVSSTTSSGGSSSGTQTPDNPFMSYFPNLFTPNSALPVKKQASLLHGKGFDFQQGEWTDLFPIATFKHVLGIRQIPETQLFASVCYPYQTMLATTVCVDANAFNGNQQEQICTAKTLTFQDQGAPIAITSIENRPTPVRVAAPGGRGAYNSVRPTFIIHFRNVGDGAVLTLPKEGGDLGSECRRQQGKVTVNINATLSGVQLDCKPNPVPINDEEGFVRCTMPESGAGTFAAPNYKGVFSVQLKYLYRTAISKVVTIERDQSTDKPLDEKSYTFPERDANPGFVNGQSRCEYCNGNRDSAECAGWPNKASTNGTFSCVCSETECLKKLSDGKCVFGSTWCPGTNYCCIPGR